MRGQQVIPAVVKHHVGSFAVDGQIARLIVGVEALSGLWIKLNLADIAEVGAIDQPQFAALRIEEYARVDGIGVFHSIGRGNYATVLKFVIGILWIETL